MGFTSTKKKLKTLWPNNSVSLDGIWVQSITYMPLTMSKMTVNSIDLTALYNSVQFDSSAVDAL